MTEHERQELKEWLDSYDFQQNGMMGYDYSMIQVEKIRQLIKQDELKA